MQPVRTIGGSHTRLSRTIHGVVYNPARDEIVIPSTHAAAILTFPGDASGNQSPLRYIQGPDTRLSEPCGVALDPARKHILVANLGSHAVTVYPWLGRGNVKPVQEIAGPKTRLGSIMGVSYDPEHDVIVVSGSEPALSRARPAIFMFRGTDNGDVAPLREIVGPKTGILGDWHTAVYKGEIFVSVMQSNLIPTYTSAGLVPTYVKYDFTPPIPTYRGVTPRPDLKAVPPSDWVAPAGFVGVWSETANGDVPPIAIIKGVDTGLSHPSSIALNPKQGEIYVVDPGRGVFTFLAPQLFGLGE
jgi:DNA-binding beta-propeller fold protein YncE